jgi:hypothetical protein
MSATMATIRILLAGALTMASGALFACGACIEDKIAATYDHATVTAAAAKGDRVVFGAIDGPIDTRQVSERLRATAPKIHGVRQGTVHASTAPPAFSFAMDRRAQPAEAAVAELEQRLAIPGLRLTVIRVQ